MSRFVLPQESVFNINGQPLPGATLDFHNVGLLTDKDTYSDEARTTPNANPVVADASGNFGNIWLLGDYDVTLKDAAGDTVWGPEKVESFSTGSTSTKLNPLTVAAMKADTSFSTADVGVSVPTTKEFSTGNGGGGTYDVELTSSVTTTDQGVEQSTAEPLISFVKRVKNEIQTATTTGVDISIPSFEISDGDSVFVLMDKNSSLNSTFDGKSLKILDVAATEESEWTITSATSATRDQAKVLVYRNVYENLLSSDVVYKFTYRLTGDFWEVEVPHIYKHLFIPCGFGKEITELQDAIRFASQFTCSNNMDPQFVNVQASTEFYPNKAEISIVLPQGTAGTPVVSTMTKRVRAGESDLSNVNIYNEGFYTGTADVLACEVNLNFLPNTDDTALLNFWKADLGEVRYITWKFSGEFSANNQAVVKYIDSRSKFKNCNIDITSATAGGGVTNVYGFYDDKKGNSNTITVFCPVSPASWLTAFATATGGSTIKVTGKPNIAIECFDDSQFFGLDIPDTPNEMFKANRGNINIGVNSATSFTADYLYNISSPVEGVLSLDSSITLTNITNASDFNPSINKFNEKGTMIKLPSAGVIQKNWLAMNTVSLSANQVGVSLQDGALNNLFVSSGTATISHISLDIGVFDGFSVDYAIDLYVKKSGGGTLTFDDIDVTGTHDGSSGAATLSDSGESWVTNELVGRTIQNSTDGSSGLITANTATTITATLSGGTDNDWDSGDSYLIDSNVLPANSGAPYTVTNANEPIRMLYDPSISKWVPVVHV